MPLGTAPLTSCVFVVNLLNIFSTVILPPEVDREMHNLKIESESIGMGKSWVFSFQC